jgi:hypothetical protein
MTTSRAATTVAAAIAALVIGGTVHLVEAPSTVEDATYLGLAFLANFAVSIAAVILIARGSRIGWGLGTLVTAGSVAAYIVSRTVGLPGQSGEEWLEFSGVIAVLSELAFLVIAGAALPILRSGRTPRVAFAATPA